MIKFKRAQIKNHLINLHRKNLFLLNLIKKKTMMKKYQNI